jgi:chromosome segregation ATPase
MAQDKLFGNALYGYQKNQVDEYVKKMMDELAKKDKEIAALKSALTENQKAYDWLKAEAGNLDVERQKIANALLKAEEKAEEVIRNVHAQAEEEKRALEEMLEKERERIVDMRSIVKTLREEVVSMLQHFEVSISAIEEKMKDA